MYMRMSRYERKYNYAYTVSYTHLDVYKRQGIESTSFYNVYATCNNYDYSGNSKS